jgi:DinB superfamily
MHQINRQAVLDLLDGDWADYVARFQLLPPAAQAVFLEKQGYKRLADLLAHIVAWWQEGMHAIQRYKDDPAARQPEIDIDRFNALAVERVRTVSQAEEIAVFEETRRKFVELVQKLSDDDFKDERVLNQIKWELINHLEDHRIQ